MSDGIFTPMFDNVDDAEEMMEAAEAAHEAGEPGSWKRRIAEGETTQAQTRKRAARSQMLLIERVLDEWSDTKDYVKRKVKGRVMSAMGAEVDPFTGTWSSSVRETGVLSRGNKLKLIMRRVTFGIEERLGDAVGRGIARAIRDQMGEEVRSMAYRAVAEATVAAADTRYRPGPFGTTVEYGPPPHPTDD
jgi:hypothetical protein